MKKTKFLFIMVVIFVAVIIMPTIALADDPLLNLKFYLIDANSNALPGYIVTIDNDHQAVADNQGVVSFPATKAIEVDTFKVFTPDKKQIGICNVAYKKADKISVSDTALNGTYDVFYDTADATVYIYMLVDPKGNENTLFHPADASNKPLTPGKEAPKPTEPPITNPVIHGCFIDADGAPMVNATVESINDGNKKSLSGTTNADGTFHIAGITKGDNTIKAYDEDNNLLGEIDFKVETGSKTVLIKENGGDGLQIKSGVGAIFINLQSTNDAKLNVIAVSEKELKSPVTAKAKPTEIPEPMPSIEPMPTGEAEEVVTGQEPSPEESIQPTVQTTPQPTLPQEKPAIDNSMLILLVVIIAAVVAVVITVIVVKKRR